MFNSPVQLAADNGEEAAQSGEREFKCSSVASLFF